MKLLRHLAAILALPGTVLILVPTLITRGMGPTQGWGLPSPWNLAPLSGLLLIGLGLWLMVQTIRLFTLVGDGTLAPWDPTQRLVVRCIYRHVRNPMISGVLFILLGEAALLGSMALFFWFLTVAAVSLIYIPLFEEPGLEDRFGQDYVEYKRHVPRWLPRLSPWIGLNAT